MNAIDEIKELSIYLQGAADGVAINGHKNASGRLTTAAEWLEELSRNICAQGFIGCRGGKNCTSDHK